MSCLLLPFRAHGVMDLLLFFQGMPNPLGGQRWPPGVRLGSGLLQGGVHHLRGCGQLLRALVAGLEGLAAELHFTG